MIEHAGQPCASVSIEVDVKLAYPALRVPYHVERRHCRRRRYSTLHADGGNLLDPSRRMLAAGAPWKDAGSLSSGHVYAVGADGSFCQRPNSLPWVSLQVENQPLPGTGRGASASPPSSFTRAAPMLMSSTSK